MNTVFNKDYFKNRNGNDDKRMASFESEFNFIIKHVSRKPDAFLDVGCSTGEMIEFWKGMGLGKKLYYGMEISDHAKDVAKKNGIKFNKHLFNSKDYFSTIVFRGTIQHVDTPFLYMKKAYESLKKGGKVVFLATPNANSLYFKLWKTLPFLDYPETNYYIPSDVWLEQAMKNFGFKLVEKRYPYISSPYSNPIVDHIKFYLKLFGVNVKFPFWRNSMDLIFEK